MAKIGDKEAALRALRENPKLKIVRPKVDNGTAAAQTGHANPPKVKSGMAVAVSDGDANERPGSGNPSVSIPRGESRARVSDKGEARKPQERSPVSEPSAKASEQPKAPELSPAAILEALPPEIKAKLQWADKQMARRKRNVEKWRERNPTAKKEPKP